MVDEDVDTRDWGSVVAAMSRNMDPVRDTLFIDQTPIDSLDFASPVVGLGSKMGLDVTSKWEAETANAVAYPRPQAEPDHHALEQEIKQLPAVIDCYLPPTAELAGVAVVTIDKDQEGQALQVMDSIWATLATKTDTKFIIVCDGDVDARDWNDVIWAVTTRMDPSRDTLMVNQAAEHGARIGLDATNKLPGEASREWGTPIVKSAQVVAKVDAIWDQLGILG